MDTVRFDSGDPSAIRSAPKRDTSAFKVPFTITVDGVFTAVWFVAGVLVIIDKVRDLFR